MIRLFIGVPLPQPVRYSLHAMGRGLHGARPVPEDQIHLTLRFIGEVEGSVFKDVKESLQHLTFESFSIQMLGIGHFPPRGKPRVLWAGVSPKEELVRLRNSIEKRLSRCNIPPEERKFSPHVTLARLKSSSMARVGQFLAGNSFFDTDLFPVNCFHLYSSKLTPKGAIHTIEHTYSLGEGEEEG